MIGVFSSFSWFGWMDTDFSVVGLSISFFVSQRLKQKECRLDQIEDKGSHAVSRHHELRDDDSPDVLS